MSARVGFVGGFLGLTLLQAVASSDHATGRIGQALTGAATIIRRLSDPKIPGIPDLRTTNTKD